MDPFDPKRHTTLSSVTRRQRIANGSLSQSHNGSSGERLRADDVMIHDTHDYDSNDSHDCIASECRDDFCTAESFLR